MIYIFLLNPQANMNFNITNRLKQNCDLITLKTIWKYFCFLHGIVLNRMLKMRSDEKSGSVDVREEKVYHQGIREELLPVNILWFF